MKPAPFAYFDPRTVEDAVALLGEHADAKVLAGGQSLMPLLNMRLARPAAVIDINRIEGLDYIREESGGALTIGAMTRQREIERSEVVRTKQPLLHAATRLIAHPQIRNRGTIGGSLAHADPAAEYPAVALVLDAEMRIAGPGGARTVAARDFFVTYLTTALDAADVLTEVRFPPLPERAGWSFLEVSRRHGDFALTGVAAVYALDASGVCAEARLALFGVAPTPIRAAAAEALLRGQAPSGAMFAEAGEAAAGTADDALSDVHASAEYRRHLVRVLTRRALVEASSRAAGGSAG
jgi:carbon-monoxide dehydrogenase medium subunit